MKRFISIALLTVSTAASAQFYNGNDLLQRMDSGEPHHQMLGHGVRGWRGGHDSR